MPRSETMKVYNFNAGPAMLPAAVMERAQKEFCNYADSGCGIMEHSHRHKIFEAVLNRANENIREIMNVPENYDIVYIQGGASMQFAMVPMNLALPGKPMEFADTGTWSSKAIKEAKLFGEVKVIASSKEDKYTYIPDPASMHPSDDASFFHITSNNTIFGTQYQSFPECKCPMIADMSSDIMSRPVDISKFGLIYAGAQKNLGPAGMAVVIIRKDLAERNPANVPTILRYSTYTQNNSLYNTPPTFGIYMISLVTDWVKDQGGLTAIEANNSRKAEMLYAAIDASEGFYRNPVKADSRSKMNVIWRLPTEELEAEFVKESIAAGMLGLKGHRSVGGIRASIYNAVTIEGVEKLVDFMEKFRKNH